MSDWGLSLNGFKAKSFHAVKEEIEFELKKNVDPNLRFTPDTVAGQLTGIMAHQIRQVWEMAAGLYSSLDSNAATGKALDILCALTGTYRKQAAPSKATLLVTLAGGAKISQGIIVADEAKSALFKTQTEVTNSSKQEKVFSVEAVAQENGPIFIEAGKLTTIVTPQAGLLRVNNPKDAVPGCHTESDVELRPRRVEELKALGSATHEAMSARLLKVKDVAAVHIEERPHEFCAYVMGGDEQEIAQTIWQHKPLGVHTFGSITKEATASNGQQKTISFARPVLIDFTLHLNLKVKQTMSDDELSALKNNIIIYCKQKFSLGDVPYPSQLYSVLFAQSKILDVLNIQLRHNGRADVVPQIIKPYELVRITSNGINIVQILEAHA